MPPTHVVNVKGLKLTGGLLYVGTSLDDPRSTLGVPDPALINPSLPVDFRHPDRAGAQMDYWPSYSQISPACRAAYLEWLASGRTGGTYIGYVFLFFYGLERRVLVDAPRIPEAKADIPLIVAEIHRLLDLYGQNNSFRGYATNFLVAAQLIHGISDTTQLAPPQARVGWDFPLDLKIALGLFVRRGQPIPGKWALSWIKSHPDIRLRTPATRCAAEFHDLFLRRYADDFGDGMIVRPNKTPLRLSYRPASAAFRQPVEFDVGDLPDVTRLSAPIKRLMAIADRVTDELDAYSRWIGRHGTGQSLPAFALLPADYVSGHAGMRPFAAWLDQQLGSDDRKSVSVSDLVSRWSSESIGAFGRREAEMLCRLLERCGFGIEPDIRFSGINVSKSASATLFRLTSKPPTEPSDAYKAAAALMRLGTVIAQADGQVSADEQRFLNSYVTEAFLLSGAEQDRLRAHLHWLVRSPANITGMKERCALLDAHQRQRFGQFLIGVAGADGQITPDELRLLEKTYRMLGLDADNVVHDVHMLSLASSAPGAAPSMAPVASDPVSAFKTAGSRSAKSDKTIKLSSEKVAAIMAETHVVTSILEQVFVEDEPEPAQEDDETEFEPEINDRIPGLDVLHTTLVRHLMERPMWARYEVDALSERLGLMTAGAIEVINDSAFDIAGEPFAEGDDPLEINAEVFKTVVSV